MRVVHVVVALTCLGLVVSCGDNLQPPAPIGGTVAGLEGSGLVLRNGSEELAVPGDGTFTFPTPVAIGSTYEVTVASQPTSPSQTCMVANGSGRIETDDPITNIAVTCKTGVFTVGGTISGLAGAGLVLQNNGTDDLAVSADGTFTFATPVASGAAFAVTVKTQPSSPTQTCTVSGATGTVGAGPVTTVVVDCATNRYTVGGVVAGLAGTVVLQNSGGDDITVSSNGSFAFPTTVASGATYDVTILTQPGTPSQTCVVTSGSGTVVDADITAVRVDCTTNTFTIGGTVTGLAGSGLVLQNNAGDNLAITGDGTFTFATPIDSGATYAVTVLAQPSSPTQVCTVTNATGAVGGTAVTNVTVTCATSAFTIGGTVSGLAGTGLVLQNNAGDDLAIAGDGTFTFATPVASGASYAVTVKTQPASPTQTCTVSGGTGTVGAGAVTSVAVNCTTNTYTIGGTITGLAGTVTLRNNGGNDLTLTANGTFAFSMPVASGAGYAVTVQVQPTSPSQTCTVTNGTGTVGASNVTSVAVTCTTNQFTIGGTVSGLAGTGLVLQNNAGDNLAITGNGTFTFSTAIDSGTTYAVTVLAQPTALSQTCTVTNGTGVVGGAAVTDVAITCTTNTYRIGGTVSGLVGSGLVLRNNGGDNLPINANGTFEFATNVPSGGTYAVTVFAQPTAPWQTCVVGSGSGSVTSADITSVTITCTTNTYTVGGTVTGLAGAGLVLQNNAGDNLAITGDGTFTFTTEIASGAGFDVTVLAQPTGPTQTCTVSGGTGTIGGNDVTSVTVDCTTNRYTISGTVTGLAGSGLVLHNNAADDLSITANGTFSFATTVASGAPYSVTVFAQPLTPAQTCVVTSGSGTVTNADIADVQVTCTTNRYTIQGTLNGLAPGDTVVLRNNGADDLALTANGAFAFPVTVPSGQPYAVTVFADPVSPVAQTCLVTNGSGIVGNSASDVANVVVTCTTNQYSIGGTVSAMTGTGLVLSNGSDTVTVNANGTFTFSAPVPSGQSYNVTVTTHPVGEQCTVTNGSGTVAASNVTNVAIACVVIPAKRVFISSAVYTGNLGGLAGADAKCQALATAAGLSGTYRAWLSSATESPSTRFTHSNGRYTLVDGTVVANSWADLTDNTLAHAIDRTETNAIPPPGYTGICGTAVPTAWSNTFGNGTRWASSSCGDWTTTSGGGAWGRSDFVNDWWSAWCVGGSCTWTAAIYCFEQ